jgi:hypothetical protein
LKLFYKENKITLQDVSLSNTEGPTTTNTYIFVVSKFELEVKSTKEDELKPQGHNKEAQEVINSKEQGVIYLLIQEPIPIVERVFNLNTKEPIPTVVVYHHPHHIENQLSSRRGVTHQHTYAPIGNQKGNQSRGTWRPTKTTGSH